MAAPDVAVVGGGIVGVAAAAHLARAGAAVELFERADLAAAASGRNSGAIQHPFDAELAPLHAETLAIYRELEDLALPAEPAGLLMLGTDAAALRAAADGLAASHPELEPRFLDVAQVAAEEPALAPGLYACRLATGWPVAPWAATRALARAARDAGAGIRTGTEVVPWIDSGRALGVREGDRRHPAGAVLVAAGPWTPGLVDPSGAWRPIAPLWGAVAEVALPAPPRHVVEEAGVEAVVAASGSGAVPLFSLVTAQGACTVGSTFDAAEPDPGALAPALLERGARFVPALADAAVRSARACPRPQSADGRPLLGPVEGVEGLHVAAGHGPWGISTGPGSARLVADALLGRVDAIPPALAARRARWRPPRT